ncbi:MAG: FAD-dependent oxidoreductase [Vicinamibacteraceae bacterium]|nr:FAD-dependent oxidoreductase [Vicinamibacteraceae bacterium]
MPAARRVVVVGASAAGLRAAARLARLEPRTSVLVVEAREVFSYAACGLPFALGGEIDPDDALRRTSWGRLRDVEYFAEAKRVEVRTGCRATSIDLASARLHVEDARGSTEALAWDDLVLATGARPRRLPNQPVHPRILALHVFEDVATLRRGLVREGIGRVAIVGAGLVGCELAEALRSLWGVETTLVEAAGWPLPGVLDPEMAQRVAGALTRNGVDLRCGAPVRALVPGDAGVVVALDGGDVEADAVVVAIGAEPCVELAAAAGIAMGPTGAIAVDERLATSAPRVWAAGDCIEVRDAVTGAAVYRPLGGLANRQGRTLGDVLAGRPARFPAVAGACAVRVFDENVAAVGWTRVAARRDRVVRSAWLTADDRPHYWPEARTLAMSLVYEPATGRVVGVQAVGPGDVAKRIDAATQLIARGATLDDVAQFEHAYAPPFAPAVDPLATLAWVALNQEDGIEAEPPDVSLDGRPLVDLREPSERAANPAPSADVTPASHAALRDGSTTPDPESLLICERGTRAAEAARLLRARGVQRPYLAGGLTFHGTDRGPS